MSGRQHTAELPRPGIQAADLNRLRVGLPVADCGRRTAPHRGRNGWARGCPRGAGGAAVRRQLRRVAIRDGAVRACGSGGAVTNEARQRRRFIRAPQPWRSCWPTSWRRCFTYDTQPVRSRLHSDQSKSGVQEVPRCREGARSPWRVKEPSGGGYTYILCGCPDKHHTWVHRTPSNRNYYRRKRVTLRNQTCWKEPQ